MGGGEAVAVACAAAAATVVATPVGQHRTSCPMPRVMLWDENTGCPNCLRAAVAAATASAADATVAAAAARVAAAAHRTLPTPKQTFT